MSVRGWNCERCGVFTQALFFWPGPANPTHNVCRRCYALLWTASQYQYQVTTSGSTADYVLPQGPTDNTSGCPYQPPPPATEDNRVGKNRLIPEGREMYFLWTWWRVHRGLSEPLRNRIVAPEPALEGAAGR